MLVVIVFLQCWRATVIPMVAIPISLIGTCGALVHRLLAQQGDA
ncbi:MAG: efflux RND transporter permease subunit [Sphingomonadales bacterium]|nr:efflux RND transporter permease subunit [Sphingomonadales bacterium]